jgi:hypothetical protein
MLWVLEEYQVSSEMHFKAVAHRIGAKAEEWPK